jgi:hypothetical protein
VTCRRDLLKAAAVVVATSSSIGPGHRCTAAHAARSQIDYVLPQVSTRDAVGVLAMVATDKSCSQTRRASARHRPYPRLTIGAGKILLRAALPLLPLAVFGFALSRVCPDVGRQSQLGNIEWRDLNCDRPARYVVSLAVRATTYCCASASAFRLD